MNYIIENNNLRVEISDLGAELQSIYGKTTDFEYLWQGNPQFWSGRAYNLFPICGRLTEGKYLYKEKEYKMGIHGFAKYSTFNVVDKGDESIVFELIQNEETLSIFPFEFCLRINYTLNNAKLTQKFEVVNNGEEDLFFSFGVHYGFNIPLCHGAKFDEHYIEFIEEKNQLVRGIVASNGLLTTVVEPYLLEEDRYLQLSHKLFEKNSIFLSNMGNVVALKSNKSDRFVKLNYHDMKHLILWHTLNTEAPFLCIEPWYGSPSFDGAIDDLITKKDSVKRETNKTYNSIIELTFNE